MHIENHKGFTLIELLVVITILGIVGGALALPLIQGMGSAYQAEQRLIALLLAQSLLEEIHSKCWDETEATPSPCTGKVFPSSLGPDPGETRATFDDVDDFEGWTASPPQDARGTPLLQYAGYTRQVSVCYVDPGDLDTCLPTGTSSYKRIQVTVTSPQGESVTLTSLETTW